MVQINLTPMKKIHLGLLALVAVLALTVATLYLSGNLSSLEGKFSTKLKTSNGMEGEETREFKPTTNGMEAEETRE